jgi:hypothetical protein
MPKLNVKNAQFLFGSAAGIPSTPFGQVVSGSIDLGEVNMVDTTTITDGTKTMVAGTRESISGSVTLVWDPAESSHAALMTKYLAKTLGSIGFKLRTSSASPTDIVHYYSDAYITNISAPIGSNAGDSAMECTMSFKGTDKFTRA